VKSGRTRSRSSGFHPADVNRLTSVNWDHWLKQDALYLPQAVYLLFQQEPYSVEEIVDRLSVPIAAPVRPRGMGSRRYRDLRMTFWLAFLACEEKSLKSSGSRSAYKVRLYDFLEWALGQQDRVAVPDQFRSLLKKLRTGANVQARTKVEELVRARWAEAKATNPNLTKTEAARCFRKSPEFRDLHSLNSIRNILKGVGTPAECRGGRPRKPIAKT
jgi:hypothetical protein